jgi:hypothetical protein
MLVNTEWGLCKIAQMNKREAIVQEYYLEKIVRHPVPYGKLSEYLPQNH